MLPKKQALMNEDYDRFIKAWGTSSQVLKTIGEMAELTEVLSRELIAAEHITSDFYQSPTFEDILSEIADVYLVIDQLAFIFGRPRVKEIIAEKLEKALRKLPALFSPEESTKK